MVLWGFCKFSEIFGVFLEFNGVNECFHELFGVNGCFIKFKDSCGFHEFYWDLFFGSFFLRKL